MFFVFGRTEAHKKSPTGGPEIRISNQVVTAQLRTVVTPNL